MDNPFKSYSEIKPKLGEPVLVLTKQGPRKATTDMGYFGWRLTDCTHPAQNCVVLFDDAPLWMPNPE